MRSTGDSELQALFVQCVGVVLDHPGRRPGGPSWLYGSERERTIARVRGLIAGAGALG